jgi:hypothetical protein
VCIKMTSNPLRNEAHDLLKLFMKEPSNIVAERFADKMKICIDGDVQGYVDCLKKQVDNLYHMYCEAESKKQAAEKKVDVLMETVQRQTAAMRHMEMEIIHAKIEHRRPPQLK